MSIRDSFELSIEEVRAFAAEHGVALGFENRERFEELPVVLPARLADPDGGVRADLLQEVCADLQAARAAERRWRDAAPAAAYPWLCAWPSPCGDACSTFRSWWLYTWNPSIASTQARASATDRSHRLATTRKW